MIVKRYLIYSGDRDIQSFPSPNSYSFDLPEKVENVVDVCVRTGSFPNSEYTVSEYNDTFQVYIDNTDTMYDIFLPQGYYSFTTLTEQVKNSLTEQVQADPENSHITFDLAADLERARFEISNGDNEPFELWFLPDSEENDVNILLGFENNLEYRSEADATGETYFVNSPNRVNVSGNQLFRIKIEEFESEFSSGTVAYVPVNVNPQDIVYYKNDQQLSKRFVSPRTIQNLHISVTNENDRPVLFNGIDHCFVLELLCEDF